MGASPARNDSSILNRTQCGFIHIVVHVSPWCADLPIFVCQILLDHYRCTFLVRIVPDSAGSPRQGSFQSSDLVSIIQPAQLSAFPHFTRAAQVLLDFPGMPPPRHNDEVETRSIHAASMEHTETILQCMSISPSF